MVEDYGGIREKEPFFLSKSYDIEVRLNQKFIMFSYNTIFYSLGFIIKAFSHLRLKCIGCPNGLPFDSVLDGVHSYYALALSRK